MADKEYILGNKARELVKYTIQVTKVVTGDVASGMSGKSSRKSLSWTTSAM